MKNWIVKSNEWYDNLPEIKRDLFFLIVIMGSLLIAQYFMIVEDFIWAFPIWAFFISFWRISYVFYLWKNNTKK